jgi:hypothetical protein
MFFDRCYAGPIHIVVGDPINGWKNDVKYQDPETLAKAFGTMFSVVVDRIRGIYIYGGRHDIRTLLKMLQGPLAQLQVLDLQTDSSYRGTISRDLMIPLPSPLRKLVLKGTQLPRDLP